jgi:hypothetical protein
MEITKKDIKIISVKTSKDTTINFDIDYLIKQRADIVAQRDRDNAMREIEIAEIDVYLNEGDKLEVNESITIVPKCSNCDLETMENPIELEPLK